MMHTEIEMLDILDAVIFDLQVFISSFLDMLYFRLVQHMWSVYKICRTYFCYLSYLPGCAELM